MFLHQDICTVHQCLGMECSSLVDFQETIILIFLVSILVFYPPTLPVAGPSFHHLIARYLLQGVGNGNEFQLKDLLNVEVIHQWCWEIQWPSMEEDPNLVLFLMFIFGPLVITPLSLSRGNLVLLVISEKKEWIQLEQDEKDRPTARYSHSIVALDDNVVWLFGGLGLANSEDNKPKDLYDMWLFALSINKPIPFIIGDEF